MESMHDPADTSGNLIAASMVNGTAVYNTAGERLGSVHDVMLEKASGKASYAIMSFGGFLGIGEQYHPLPWNQLTYDQDRGGYVVNLDRQRLEGGPAYAANDLGRWDQNRVRDIDDYYGGVAPTGGIGEPVVAPGGRLVP